MGGEDASGTVPGALPRVATRALLVVGWLIVGTLGIVFLLRLVAYDDSRLVLALVAVTYWIYLPAYFVLAGAIAFRRYALVCAAAALVLVHIVLVWPSLGSASALPSSVRRARGSDRTTRH